LDFPKKAYTTPRTPLLLSVVCERERERERREWGREEEEGG
jgi:hypothetical protein